MDGWMDGWMGRGWVGEWWIECMGQMNGQTNWCMYGRWRDACTNVYNVFVSSYHSRDPAHAFLGHSQILLNPVLVGNLYAISNFVTNGMCVRLLLSNTNKFLH